MNSRNLILELIWERAEWIALLPIAAAVIIVGINVYMLFPVKQSVVCEAEMVAVEKKECKEALYMEETRFSDTEILER